MTIPDVQDVLTALDLECKIRSSNVVLSCPFAAVGGHKHKIDNHPSLGILPNEEGAIFNCFTCRRKGSIDYFLSLLERELAYNVAPARELLMRLLWKSPTELAKTVPEYEQHFAPNERLLYPTFPETWFAPYAHNIPRYILRRGVTIDTCKAFGIGYDVENERVLFPVRDSKKKLVGAVGGLIRPPLGDYEPKYRNYWHRIHAGKCGAELVHRDSEYRCPQCRDKVVPPAEVGEGFRKSNFLYGEWKAPARSTVVAVEGIIDALMIWQAVTTWRQSPRRAGFRSVPPEEYFPMALFGAEPSARQADKIVKLCGVQGCIIFFDNDQAGDEGAASLARRIGRRVRVRRVDWPLAWRILEDEKERQRRKDTGGLRAPEIRKLLIGAKMYFGPK